MSNIKEIVKNTLFSLKKQSREVSPDVYFAEFCRQAKIENFECKECELLQSIKKEYSLETNLTINDFSSLLNIITQKHKESLKQLSMEFNEILTPSINFEIQDELEEFSKSLFEKPNKLLERETITKLKDITKKRIEEDRKVLRNKTDDIIKLTSLVSKQFENTLLSSCDSEEELVNIKEKVSKLDMSESSLRELSILQLKLIDTVNNLEETIDKHKVCLIEEKNNFSILEEKFLALQKALKTSEDEKNTDYLTKILNRRAFDKEIKKVEKKYNTFESPYAIVFYDIDFFKKINDTYGHDCGDAVLRTFAAILKNLTRQNDTVARFGGEEFVVILNYTDTKEISKYINRVKELVKKSEFKYNNQVIDVKFSAGVAFRPLNESYSETLHKADELLYEAKNTGRDRVVLNDKTII